MKMNMLTLTTKHKLPPVQRNNQRNRRRSASFRQIVEQNHSRGRSRQVQRRAASHSNPKPNKNRPTQSTRKVAQASHSTSDAHVHALAPAATAGVRDALASANTVGRRNALPWTNNRQHLIRQTKISQTKPNQPHAEDNATHNDATTEHSHSRVQETSVIRDDGISVASRLHGASAPLLFRHFLGRQLQVVRNFTECYDRPCTAPATRCVHSLVPTQFVMPAATTKRVVHVR